MAQHAPVQAASQNHLAFKCVNPERCLAATADNEVTTEEYDPESVYQCWVKEGRDASFTLKNCATGEYLGLQNGLVVLLCTPFRWSYDREVKQINPKSNNKLAITIDDDDVHNVEIKKGLTRDQSQKWNCFNVTHEAMPQYQNIWFKCVNPERCLAVTTDKEITTEESDPESVYQCWVKEGQDSSFTLKNRATGEFLGVKNGLVVLQSSPFRWSYNGALKQINPMNKNEEALAIDDYDVHSVEIKNLVQRSQSLQWNYFNTTHKATRQNLILVKCVNPERYLAATTEKEITTEVYDPDSAYQCWVKEGNDAAFSLKSGATGEYLGVKNGLVVLQSSPFHWRYDVAVKQINPRNNNEEALTINDSDVHTVEIKNLVRRGQSLQWTYFRFTPQAL